MPEQLPYSGYATAGPDQIQPELLCYGRSPLSYHLSILFNLIVNTEYIPSSFQQGLIIPIPKSLYKDPSDLSNYRGITLQSVLAEVFEKIILLWLLDSNVHDPIHPLQGVWYQSTTCTVLWMASNLTPSASNEG